MTKHPANMYYKRVAEQLVATLEPRCAATAASNDRPLPISYTRKPTGAWVPVWVWVPKEMALLEKTK